MSHLSRIFMRTFQFTRSSMPARSAYAETMGFVVFAMGVLVGLSLFTYTQADLGITGGAVRNLAGPLGAELADLLLRSIGVVSLAWMVAMLFWGLLLTLGFVRWPQTKLVIAFFLLTAVSTGFADVLSSDFSGLNHPYGYGGGIGEWLGGSLVAGVGFGGALVVLTMLCAASLVLTGNVKFSRTAEAVEYGIYFFRHRFRIKTENKESVPAARAGTNQTEGLSGEDNQGEAAPSAKRTRKAKVNDESSESEVLELSSSVPKSERPDPKIFQRAKVATEGKEDFDKIAKDLTGQLHQFKVEGEVCLMTEGPVVSTLEFEPAPGTKVSKIVSLGEDLARLLKAQSLRVIAPVPGKSTVGFEVPNKSRKDIPFGNLIDSKQFKSRGMALPIAMGVDVFGAPVIEDLAEMPHLLVAGSTGSGKSVFINTLIASLVCRNTAKDLRLIMVDPKMVELGAYNKLPHMACEVVTDPKNKVMKILNSLVDEMENRYRMLGALGAKNLKGFNEIIKTRRKMEFPDFEGKWQAMPYVVLIIDEFADMIMVLGKEAEDTITRLAQKARAAGIHLVIATQRPSVQVVTGMIKANFPTRVAFRVHSGVDSRTIIDQQGAETLLGKGDMIFQNASGVHRLHASYLSDPEVTKMVKACGGKR